MSVDGKQRHISKDAATIHNLAKKKYLCILLDILLLTNSTRKKDIQRRHKLIERLKKLIETFERGKLDLRQIVLTNQQYHWFTGEFVRKRIDADKAIRTACGILVRSKSERDIVNYSEGLAVPLHYEERMLVYVKPLVDELERELKQEGLFNRELYRYINGNINWNVPPEYAWINTRGSIWKSYHPPTGKIMIFNDFRIMLADGSILIHEHSGLMSKFRYRQNETERIAVMKITGSVDRNHLIETYEQEIDTPEKLIDIIEKYILPRLWF